MYIDVLFALNFMMDVLVLLCAFWFLNASKTPVLLCVARIRARKWWILGGACIGAVGSCVVTVLQLLDGSIGRLMQSGVAALVVGILICVVMVKAAFSPRSVQGWIQDVLVVYGITFLIGGMLGWLQAHIQAEQYALLVSACFMLVVIGQFVYTRVKERTTPQCTLRIMVEKKTVTLKGLMDTGNLLKIPVIGTPVTVVSAAAVLDGMSEVQKTQYTQILKTGQLPTQTEKAAWQLIPYHSVGCAGGLLPVLRVSHMCIVTEQKETVLDGAMIGLCAHRLSGSGAYDAIVNPDLNH